MVRCNQPAGNELVIYEMHIGTFDVKQQGHPDRFDSAVVVVNMTNQNRDGYVIGFPQTGLRKTRFNSEAYNYGVNFANHPTPDVETREKGSDDLPCSGEISIGPYTVVIFSQDS